MRIDEYLDTVCGEIRWKAARKQVRDEIRSHIEQRMEEYQASGDSREAAEEKAVANMGDAAKTGKDLDRLHRPRYDWVFFGVLLGLLVLGLLYTFTTDSFDRNALNWLILTLSALAGCCIFTLADIRKMTSEKTVAYSLFFGSILYILLINPIVGWLYPELYMGLTGDILTAKLAPLVSMLLFVITGVLIAKIKSGKSLFFILAFIVPYYIFTYCPEYLVCVWAMLWVIKGKKRIPALIVLPVSIILCPIVYCLLYSPDGLSGLRWLLSGGNLTDPMYFQVKCMASNLKLFGAGGNMAMVVPDNMYALINIMWQYGLAAGLAVLGLCGVVLWRLFRMLLRIHDTVGRAVTVGICTLTALLIVSNVLLNFGIGPCFTGILPTFSGYMPMFSQVWAQTALFGCMVGILAGLYRRKDFYSTRSVFVD